MPLFTRLKEEYSAKISGGIYHKTQVLFAYNTNHIEGSQITEEQTEQIFNTKTLLVDKDYSKVIGMDDLMETMNHFKCFDYLLSIANEVLTEEHILKFHQLLKRGTSMEENPNYPVGSYKIFPNVVGDLETTEPEKVGIEIAELLETYNASNATFESIVDFHVNFERIHPFADGNGRVGRLLIYKECLRAGIIPFIILDEFKLFYYRGLKEYSHEKGFMLETCGAMQDAYAKWLDYFKIEI